ncbi:MAG: hypothetical protein AAB394_04055 [Patescibacteria group bacterium]
MINYFKKILYKIHCSNFPVKNLLYILFFISLFISLPSLLTIIYLNKTIFILLLPFALFFTLLGVKGKLEIGQLLSSASIVLAVLFFIFQATQEYINKKDYLANITKINCGVINSIENLGNADLAQNFQLSSFITEPYTENINFLVREFSTSTGYVTPSVIWGMNDINSLITTVNHINAQGLNLSIENKEKYIKAINTYNKQILDTERKINNILNCPKK